MCLGRHGFSSLDAPKLRHEKAKVKKKVIFFGKMLAVNLLVYYKSHLSIQALYSVFFLISRKAAVASSSVA